MNCAKHPQLPAVGTCSSCRQGVCSTCCQTVEGTTYCVACITSIVNAEISAARTGNIFAWVVSAAIAVFVAIAGGGVLYAIPGFIGGWCLYWGWLPVWRGFRNFFAGWGVFGSWLFVLIVVAVLAEVLILVAMAIGLFRGIPKYLSNRQLIKQGPPRLAELELQSNAA